MCKVPVKLRELVKQRLAAAAEEIFELLERTITEYEELNQRKQNSQQTVYATVVPDAETPVPAAVQTFNVVLDAAHVFEENLEPERVQIINAVETVKEEQLQCSTDAPLVKEEEHSVLISSVVSFSAVKEEQSEIPTFSLDLLKQEEIKDEQNPIALPQINPEPARTNFNKNRDKEECDNWEFEGLSEQTENSSEEELSPPKKKPTLKDVSHRTERATVSNDVSCEAASSDDKTENSSDVSENEDKTGENSNQNHEENREVPADVIRFQIVSNHTIRTLNFKVEKGNKMAVSSGKVCQKRKGKRRRRKRDKTVENGQSESDSGVKETSHGCSACDRTFDSLQKLKAHVRAHKAETLSCSVCEKKFKAKPFLNRHMKIHKAPAATAKKRTSDDKINTKWTLAAKKHDETDTDKTKDSSDET